MHKITVLYNHPDDPEQFEKYYDETHLPLARHMPNVSRLELTKFEGAPGGGKPAYYRMAEIYFSSFEVLQESMGTPESQATIDDLHHFATAGVTILLGSIEKREILP